MGIGKKARNGNEIVAALMYHSVLYLDRKIRKNPNPFPIRKIWFGLYWFGAVDGTWTHTSYNTRPSNVPVCQFQHYRIWTSLHKPCNGYNYTKYERFCQPFRWKKLNLSGKDHRTAQVGTQGGEIALFKRNPCIEKALRHLQTIALDDSIPLGVGRNL